MTIKNFHMNAANRQFLIAKINALDPHQVWTVNVAQRKSKRSNEQNRWMRGLAQDLGEYLGYAPDEMYTLIMYKFCPEFITLPDGKELRVPGHFSTKQDGTPRPTDDAARIQEAVIQWAAELGFLWNREAA